MGKEAEAHQAYCDAQAGHITAHLSAHLSPPVSPQNKNEILKQIQAWIIKERRQIEKALKDSGAQEPT